MPSADFFDRREAKAIADKLGATIEPGRKHDAVVIRWGGTIIARYGLRRDRTASHPYIPDQLGLKLREAIELARCPLSAEKYFELMAQRGRLPRS